MKRRDAVRLLGAAALSPQAEAWARHDTALKGSASPRAPRGAGRLKQSVCRWPYRQIPLPELCRAALDIGLGGVDLLTRDEGADRKSTRLNSSHSPILHAVFWFEKNISLAAHDRTLAYGDVE